MCYAALVHAEIRKLERTLGVKIDPDWYVEEFWTRKGKDPGKRRRMPRAVEREAVALAGELPDRLQVLCDFANQEDDGENFIHPVVRAIMIHFQIGYDHPFCDGNGRTARALFYWSMMRSGFWMAEYLSISSILKQAPSQYTRSYLFTETDDSDATYFLSHQLDVLLKAIASVHGYIERKQRSHAQAQTLLSPDSKLARVLNHRQRALLLNALRHPGKQFSIDAHRRAHGVSYQTARTDLLGLVDENLMEQYRQGKRFYFLPSPDLGQKLKR